MGPDLTPRWMFVKAVLFVVIVVLAASIVLLREPTWTTAACLAAIAWASSRAYYFAFYALERYVDPSLRFTGVTDLVRWRLGRGRRAPPR
jgi:hypothetical protein